jgi:nucleoside-diphosphate-sugar epimerase
MVSRALLSIGWLAGFIGTHHVRYALSRGHKVTLFNRGTHSTMWPAEVEVLTGDRETGNYASLKWSIRLAEERSFGTFNTIGPNTVLTVAQLMQTIATITNSSPQCIYAKREFLAEHKVSNWTDLPVWIDGRGESAGFHYRSNQRAIAAGLSFRPLAQTVADTLAWWNAQPRERREKLLAGISPEREQFVLGLLEKLLAKRKSLPPPYKNIEISKPR